MFNPFRLSDEQVIRRVRAGRRDDFGVLVRRYMSAIHAFACAHVGNRADAEDIVQETFLRAYESLDSLRDASRVGPWLFAIARNACRNHVRNQTRRETREQTLTPAENPAQPDPVRGETREILREKVAQLEEGAREVLLLHYFADKRIAEIADLLDISTDAAKKRLQRAREALGELVARELFPAYQSDRPDSERTKAVMGLIAVSPAPWAATAATTGAVATFSAAKLAAVGMAVLAAVGGGYVAVQTARGDATAAADRPAAASTAVSLPSPAETDAVPAPAAAPAAPATAPDAIPLAPDGSGATVRAVLRTEAGEVPPGATVRLVKRVPNEGKPFGAVAEADAKGRAYFTGVPMDFYYLRATAPGYFGAAEFTIEEEPFREVPLTLRKAGPLRGVVRDKTGRPIAGAVLATSYHKPTPQSGFTPTNGADQQTAVADASGVFTFEHLWTGYWTLQADATGFARQFTEYLKVGTTDSAIVLGRRGSLSGRVIDATTGQPVPGMAVGVSGIEPVATEPDGSFRCYPIHLGNTEIEVKDDRFVLESPRMLTTIHEGAETSGVEVRVIPAAAISGRIYRADGGQDPLQQVHVQLQSAREMVPESYWVTPDAEGRYRIAGLRPGTYTLADMSFAGNLRPSAEALARSLELKSGEEIAGVDFALQEKGEQAGIHVRGRVVDASGRPAAEATVQGMLSAGDRGYGIGGGTGDDGSFSLAFESAGSLTLEATKDGDASDTTGPFELTQAGLSGITLHLKPGGTVTGRVLEPSGEPVSKARVELVRDGSFAGQSIETGPDGVFTFRGLVPASYTVKSEAAGSATVAVTRGSRQEVTLKAGGTETAIAGRVVDEQGKPVAGASIHVDPDPGPGAFLQTDLEGRFAIPDLPPGAYDLTVTSDRHVTARQSGVPSGTKDLELVLQARGTVEGRVTLAGSTGPVEGAEVQIGPADAGPDSLAALSPGMYRAARPDGGFRIENVEPGRRSVAARAPGYAPQIVPVEVTAGQTTEGIVLTLRPGVPIEGRVVNAAGEPVAEASVFFNRLPFIPPYPRPAASLDGVALSGSDGRFRIDSVPSGVTRLAVYHPDYAPCLVAAAPGAPVNVTLTAGATVSGVVRMNGQAVPGAQLSLRLSDGNLTRHAQTDDQGGFAFTLLPPGEAHVTLSCPPPQAAGGPEMLHRAVPVPDGGATTVDFDIAAGNGAVEGSVTLPSADVQVAVTCIAQTASGSAVWSRPAAPDGTYRIDGLPAGNATVAVLCSGPSERRVKSAEVLVEAGGVARCDFDLTAPGAAITGRHAPAPGDRGMVFVVTGRHTVEELQGSSDPFLPFQHVASVRAREDGTFRVDGLDPGTYTVLTGANDATVVEVPASGEVEARF